MISFHRLRATSSLLALMLPMIFWAIVRPALAAPVDTAHAETAVKGWLRADKAPLQTVIGQNVNHVKTYNDERGNPLYHVASLNPSGFVIISADDQIEPIIGFAPAGDFDPSLQNALGALVARDLPARHARVKALAAAGVRDTPSPAKSKWDKFVTNGLLAAGIKSSLASVSDVRVAPLIQTLWDQTTTTDKFACYNYYTPPFSAGNADNYPSGCVATAMAQLMRFYQWPTTAVGTSSFVITVDGVDENRSLRGGNGSGGAYVWGSMPLNPATGSTLVQRQAIGALLQDAGVAAHMEYSPDGSGAYMSAAKAALVTTFGYGNAVNGASNKGNIGSGLIAMVNPNLDAGFPVLFGISDDGNSGHAIVADGYGYSQATLYHHLNLGWGGDANAWYNLPTIDTGYITFNVIDECTYNVWTSGTGEIISGRITDLGGNPVSGVSLTATRAAGGTYTTSSNAQGIYAFAKIPASSTYTITANKSDYVFTDQTVNTGHSYDWHDVSGNKWAIDFTQMDMTVPTITTNSPLPGGTAAISYSQNLTVSGGTTPYTWSIDKGSLPEGLSLSIGGVISGTPTVATTASFTVRVTANNAKSSTKDFSLTTSSVMVTSLNETIDQPSLTITNSGNSPWIPQAATAHDGMDAARSGIISSNQTSTMQTTVTGSGTFSFWWKVSSESGYDKLTFYIDNVAQANPISGERDWQQMSYTLATTGSHTLKWTYSKDSGGSVGSDCAWVDQLTLPVAVAPTIITTSPLPSDPIGEAYSLTLAASGGATPYTWSIVSGALPTGLTLSTAGVISGTPSTATTANFTVRVRGNDALTSSKSFTLDVVAPGGAVAEAMNQSGLTFTATGNLPWISQTTTTHDSEAAASSGAIMDNQTSVMQTKVTGSGTCSFWWKVSSERLYDFLTFYIDDVAQGSPISGEVDWQLRTYTLTNGNHTLKWIYSKDNTTSSGSDCGWVDQLIIPTAPTITTDSPLPPGTVGMAYNQTLAASNAPTPYTWSITSGTLPTGLTLSSAGLISGVPSAASNSSFTVKVLSGNGLFSTQSYILTTTAVAGVLANAVDQSALTFATSGTGNLPWFAEASITHDGVDAARSGAITDSQTSTMQTTVTGPGTVSFWWKVSSEANSDKLTFYMDNVAQGGAISGEVDWVQKTYILPTGSHTLKWTYSKDSSAKFGIDCGWVDQLIVPIAPTITSLSPLPNGTVGTAYSRTLEASDGTTPYTWSITTGSLPAGLSLSSAGVISGTPTAAITAAFTVKVTGADTKFSSKDFSLTVVPVPTYTVTFASWASVLPANQRSADLTPMNDGVTNLMKYACNMNAATPDARKLTVGDNGLAGLPGTTRVAGKLRMEFLRRNSITNPGVTYIPQFSSGVSSWVDFTGTPTVTSIDGNWERVVVDDPATSVTRFARLKVVSSP